MSDRAGNAKRLGSLIVAAGAVMIAVAIGITQIVQAGGPDVPPGTYFDDVARGPALPCTGADGRPVDVPKFSLGASFEGLEIAHQERRCDQPGPVGRANHHSVIYGDCTPKDGHGCAPPLEIQTFAACERNLALYGRGPDEAEPVAYEKGRVAGYSAAYFEDGRRVELYLTDSTVVIFGSSRGQVTRAAAKLHREQPNPNATQTPCPAPGS